MDYNKIEDAVMKKAMDVFKQGAVDFFGINTKIIAPAKTEIKNITIKTNYTDYLFYTEDGNYLHFEFQTTDKKDNISRFLYYDASLYHQEKRKINTVVIYSSEIEDAEDYVDAGTIKYSIKAFYMKSLNGDEKLIYLSQKIQNKEELCSEDILTLTLLPLMKGSESKISRTLKSIELASHIENQDSRVQCLSMLYALFEKFGDAHSKNRFKEVFSMTEIGRMILEEGLAKGKAEGKAEGMAEGMAKGKAEGKTEGKTEILIKQLIKKFKKIPNEYIAKIMLLPESTIEVIATEIFDFEKIEDIEKYL